MDLVQVWLKCRKGGGPNSPKLCRRLLSAGSLHKWALFHPLLSQYRSHLCMVPYINATLDQSERGANVIQVT